jgi:hypothetical protein
VSHLCGAYMEPIETRLHGVFDGKWVKQTGD